MKNSNIVQNKVTKACKLNNLHKKLNSVKKKKLKFLSDKIKIKNTQKVMWEKIIGHKYECKCITCNNMINVWNFIMNGSFKCGDCSQVKDYYKHKEIKRRIAWERYYGCKYDACCYICKNETINIFNFELGHSKAKSLKGSNTLRNLSPICGGCNRAMGIKNPILFQREQKYLEIDTLINIERELENDINNYNNLDIVSEVNVSEVNASEVNACEDNASEVNASEVNACEDNASKVNVSGVVPDNPNPDDDILMV